MLRQGGLPPSTVVVLCYLYLPCALVGELLEALHCLGHQNEQGMGLIIGIGLLERLECTEVCVRVCGFKSYSALIMSLSTHVIRRNKSLHKALSAELLT